MKKSESPRAWVQNLLAWYDAAKRDLPWRVNPDPYRTWVCEVMSQQTILSVVIPKFERFINELPNVAALARCDETHLRELWSGLGYYARARNLQAGARYIVDGCGGSFPRDYEGWLAVPGCGPYTAAVIASIGFQQAVACIDGNVIRVVSRLLAMNGESPDRSPWNPSGLKKIRQFVDLHVSQERPGDFNQAMMELGATLCRKSNPSCSQCPIRTECQAARLAQVAHCPPPKPRKDSVEKSIYAVVFRDTDSGDIALAERHQGFLAQTVGFPLGESAALSEMDVLATRRLVLGRSFVHTITRHKIAGKVVLCDVTKASLEGAGRLRSALGAGQLSWTPLDEVPRRLASSLDHKAWAIFLRQCGFAGVE